MDHYEVRQYPGWHHHMLTTLLAHFFLWHVKIRLGKNSPRADGVAAADVTGRGATPAHIDLEDVLEMVAWVQRCNHWAYLSHRKRRETEG